MKDRGRQHNCTHKSAQKPLLWSVPVATSVQGVVPVKRNANDWPRPTKRWSLIRRAGGMLVDACGGQAPLNLGSLGWARRLGLRDRGCRVPKAASQRRRRSSSPSARGHLHRHQPAGVVSANALTCALARIVPGWGLDPAQLFLRHVAPATSVRKLRRKSLISTLLLTARVTRAPRAQKAR